LPSVRSGGQILINQLEAHGVDLVFCIPGESYLAALDALHDSDIRVITCRHEAAAANMAEAYGKLTGRPGICFVTRGPGATQASMGVHVAFQDSTPIILFVGQVPRAMLGREAFQELDYPRVFGGLAKWVEQIDDPARIPQVVAHAFSIAMSERPGPVVLALPQDVLVETTRVDNVDPLEIPRPAPTPAELDRLRELLGGAERPLVIVGEGGWTAAASRDVLAFCEANELPIATSFACHDYVDNGSHCHVGHLIPGMDPALEGGLREADLVLAIGGRLGEMTTFGYTWLEAPTPSQTLIHAHPAKSELGRVYETDLAIVADLTEFGKAAKDVRLPDADGRRDWTAGLRALYHASLQHERLSTSELDLADLMALLRDTLPDDAIFTYGAGNFTLWPHLLYEFSQYGTQLVPQAGAMGCGLPAALTAKLLHPDRMVVCLAGDGDFMMCAAELATAIQYDLRVVVLIVNNGMYGTIRAHQERVYPGRVEGTDMVNPDFAALARAFGGHGETVERTVDFGAAFERCLASGIPAVIDLKVDPEVLAPRQTVARLRGPRHAGHGRPTERDGVRQR
jgi:acetolactate synthase-1/2/3 large subunit